MIQGTGSDVGKSLIVAGLARAFTRRGLRVRPFKPQNMSNNAAVTADGGEIGRAQALQARAARVPPSVHMNPVLLKPQSEIGSQVVVQGKVVGNAKAREYQAMKPKLLGAVLESFRQLAAEADLVLVEGAGSASEVNLRAADIANMGFARAADVPVVLMGDIDRGGVIASLVGTKAVIDPDDAAMIVGLHRQSLPRRSVAVRRRHEAGRAPHRLAVAGAGAVLRPTPIGCRPRMRSAARAGARGGKRPHADRRAGLSAHRQFRRFRSAAPRARRRSRLRPARRADSRRRRAGHPAGLEGDHRRPRRACARPAGTSTSRRICGAAATCWASAAATRCSAGSIADPDGIEGPPGSGRRARPARCRDGAGRRQGPGRGHRRDRCRSGVPFKGYEMHIGRTTGTARPLLTLDNGRPDGAVSADGRVAGCYIHGLLADDRAAPPLAAAHRRAGLGARLRSRRRRDARSAGRPHREARRLRPPARAGARAALQRSQLSTTSSASTAIWSPQAVR